MLTFKRSYIPFNVFDTFFADVCESCDGKYRIEWNNDDTAYAFIDCDDELENCSHLEARTSRIEEIIIEGITAACNRVNLQNSNTNGGN